MISYYSKEKRIFEGKRLILGLQSVQIYKAEFTEKFLEV